MLVLTRHVGEKLTITPPCDLLRACEVTATFLARRAAHYRDLGSHDVACELAIEANRLEAAIARAKAAKPIEIVVTDIDRGKVRLGITADLDYEILRNELLVDCEPEQAAELTELQGDKPATF
jgi:sRNA-binding carbon storage regulator CsrA